MQKLFLLADDDNDDAELFGEALSELVPPVDFYHAIDGEALFKYLGDKQYSKPDIVFLDVNMPGTSGWQCLAKMRNHPDYATIPVIIYSTSSILRDKEIAIELGASGYLTKPADYKILVKALESIANIQTSNLKKVLQKLVTS